MKKNDKNTDADTELNLSEVEFSTDGNTPLNPQDRDETNTPESPDETPSQKKKEEEKKSAKSDVGSFIDNLREMMKNNGFHLEAISTFQAPSSSSAKPSRKQNSSKKQEKDYLKKLREFHYLPKDIRDYLNRFVISQEEAKRVLSVAICDHYNHIRQCLNNPQLNDVDHAKHNVLMMGPTGVGKTYMMRCLAKLLGVPFVKVDATKYTETGYIGYDAEDMVRDLIKVADGNVNLAQYGIIYIDEIDKIAGCGSGNGYKDISGRGVQVNLLKIMEDSEVKVHSQTDMFSQMQCAMGNGDPNPTIRTKNILFILSGAFDKLSDIVQKRLGKSQIGFAREKGLLAASDLKEGELLHQVQTNDLVEYGFEPEFVGRVPVRVALSNLTAEDLEKVLTNVENGFLEQYQQAFEGYDISLKVEPEAIRSIAQRAADEKTGARGLLTILEKLFRNYKFELPGSGIHSLTITRQTVESPDEELKRLLVEGLKLEQSKDTDDLNRFLAEYQEKYNLALTVAPDAFALLQTQAIKAHSSVYDVCWELFRKLHHGLNMLKLKAKQESIHITQQFIASPSATLDEMLQKATHP